MPFQLPDLPFPKNALEPHISAQTLEYHHGKHHAKYVKKTNELIHGKPLEAKSLEDLVRQAEPGKLFNNAAQHWNHSFYWTCLSPDGGDPSGNLRQAIEKSFGSVDRFREQFNTTAKNVFGSGWAWLVRMSDGSLAIEQTANAENPLLRRNRKALLTCDMWEHVYYLDYQSAKQKYLDAFWNVVNWEFVASQL